MTSGFFIVFEGGEGAGKSTQTKKLAEYLISQGHDVVVTREPGGTATAEKIRDVLLDPSITNMPDETEALLFAAARADHAQNLIRPELERGAIVICDRYIESSVAYQGYARGLGAERIHDLSVWATQNLLPDFTVYLDVPIDVSVERRAGTDRMELQSSQFHEQVHQAFHTIAQQSQVPHIVLDATLPIDELAQTIAHAVDEQLNNR